MPRYTSNPLAPGNLFAGQYLVESTLGEGAMGAVAAATCRSTGQKVAIKCLLPAHRSEPTVVARFQREMRATERLRSEHVARVIDHGEIPGADAPIAFMVMERLDGCDLRTLLAQRRALSVRRAAEYVSQACVGLAEAHALGIVHRDLKPANLFRGVSASGRKIIKVLDFGIAKFGSHNAAGDARDVTQCAATMGSPSYMAPEQMLDARSVDARADVWSLGVILYQLVSGVKPFRGEQITDVAFAVITEVPAPLDQIAPHVPPAFARIVARCLEKRREDRWPSVVELARALAPFAHRAESAPRVELANRTVQLGQAIQALKDEHLKEDHPSDPGESQDVAIDEGPATRRMTA